jgi:hypothetical protein
MSTISIKEFDEIKQDFIDAIKAKVHENDPSLDITDYNVGGVLNTIVEAFSDVLEQAYFDMFQIAKESLENIYNGFNFYKIPGKKATCTVYIYFDTTDLASAQNSIFLTIPKGTVVTTEDGTIEFEIVDDYQSSALQLAGGGSEFPGQVFYTASAVSVTIGSSNNIGQNTLTKISTAITNLRSYSFSVRNASCSGGAEEETEEEMKSRFQQYLVSLRRGTTEALGFALETNANFTGFLYSINQYTPLFIVSQVADNVDQADFSLDSGVYDFDLTNLNKFDPQYTLFDQAVATAQDDYFALYLGSSNRFRNLLFATSTVSAASFEIHKVQYYDSVLGLWNDVDTDLLNITLDAAFIDDEYIYWDFADITRWGKYKVLGYEAYFIRLIIKVVIDPTAVTAAVQVFKSMTYPFPGYIDLYCLKNYRENINLDDKVVIEEAIETYKAAGVVTTVQNANVIQLYPTIIIFSSDLALAFIPDTVVSDIRADIITFANDVKIGQSFDRNAFYSYIYDKYNQYGNIFIFYEYDNALTEDLSVGIYKEQLRDQIFDMAISDKADLGLSDIFVVQALSVLSTTSTGVDVDDLDAIYASIAY